MLSPITYVHLSGQNDHSSKTEKLLLSCLIAWYFAHSNSLQEIKLRTLYAQADAYDIQHTLFYLNIFRNIKNIFQRHQKRCSGRSSWLIFHYHYFSV